jgi:hypothetical protein
VGLAETANLVVNLDLKGDFVQKTTKAQKSMAGLDKSVTKAEGRFTKLGARLRSPELKQGLLQGVGLSGGLIGFQLLSTGITGAVSAVGDAIDAASNLTESQSKVDAVFEESAPTIRRWASELDAAYGLTEQAALESAGTLGNFVQALGLSRNEAVNLSKDITLLAGDLASFNNVATEDVLVALRSGLAGETEPVRRLGIDISAARIEAQLLADGVEKVGGAFTQSQKVAARYRAIMQDTATAQGDALRTSDTLAGKQRELDAVMGDLSATVGGFVVGPATDFLGFLVDVIDFSPKVSQSTQGIAKRMRELRKDVEGATPPVEEFIAAWEPLTEDDLIPLTKVSANTKDLVPEVLRLANASRLTGDELNYLLRAAGSSRENVEALTQSLQEALDAYDPLSSITTRTASATEELGESALSAKPSLLGMSKATIEHSDALRALEQSYQGAIDRQKAFAEAASEIAETRSLGKINQELRAQRKALRQAAEAGQVRKFAAAQAAIEQLKQEKALRKQGRQALKEYQSNTKQQRQAQQRVTNKVVNTTNKLKVLGNTDANPKVTIAGIKAAQSQITRLRESLAALRAEAGITYDPLTGQLRTAAPRQSGGPVQEGRAYIVGEKRPELFVPRQSGTILPSVPQMGGDISVYVTPSLVVAAAQVEDQTTKAVRTQRFREKN